MYVYIEKKMMYVCVQIYNQTQPASATLRVLDRTTPEVATLETSQGQIHIFSSQLPFKCYVPEVASVAD